jgi:hypothetical protein
VPGFVVTTFAEVVHSPWNTGATQEKLTCPLASAVTALVVGAAGTLRGADIPVVVAGVEVAPFRAITLYVVVAVSTPKSETLVATPVSAKFELSFLTIR